MIIVAVVLSHETVTKPPDNYSIQMIIVGVVFSHETVTKPPDNYSLLGNYLQDMSCTAQQTCPIRNESGINLDLVILLEVVGKRRNLCHKRLNPRLTRHIHVHLYSTYFFGKVHCEGTYSIHMLNADIWDKGSHISDSFRSEVILREIKVNLNCTVLVSELHFFAYSMFVACSNLLLYARRLGLTQLSPYLLYICTFLSTVSECNVFSMVPPLLGHRSLSLQKLLYWSFRWSTLLYSTSNTRKVCSHLSQVLLVFVSFSVSFNRLVEYISARKYL